MHSTKKFKFVWTQLFQPLTLPCPFLSSLQFEDERIPTLKEAVALCKQLDLVMFLEIKSTTNVEKVHKAAHYLRDIIII